MLQDTTLERPKARALTAGPPPLYRTDATANVIDPTRPPSALMRGVVGLVLAWSGLAGGLRGRWMRRPEAAGTRPAPCADSAQVIDFDTLRRSGEPYFRRPGPRS